MHLTAAVAVLGMLEWPRAPLDAEHGPAGMLLTTDRSVGGSDVQWDLAPSCQAVDRPGHMGYRVVVARPPARPEHAMLVLPPIPTTYAAVRFSFWARAMLQPRGAALGEDEPDVRIKLRFVASDLAPWEMVAPASSSEPPTRSATAEVPVDAWGVRLSVEGWRQHTVRLQLPPKARKAKGVVAQLHLGGLTSLPNTTFCFDVRLPPQLQPAARSCLGR